MKGKVIKPFFDLSNPEDVYSVGDVFEGTAERVDGLANMGFVEPIKEEKPKRTTRKKPTIKEQ